MKKMIFTLVTIHLLVVSTLISQPVKIAWASQIGGSEAERCNAIAVDGEGNVYSAGGFSVPVDFDPGEATFLLEPAGFNDIYIQKLNAAGQFVWAKSIAGSYGEIIKSMQVDGNGNIYATGCFSGTVDFDPGVNNYSLTSMGSNDIFVLKLDTNGRFLWAKQMGGLYNDQGQSLSIDPNENILVTGYFKDVAQFDSTVPSDILEAIGWESDIFILKLNSAGELLWVKRMGGPAEDVGVSLTVDELGNIYTTGIFNGNVDFDPGSGESIRQTGRWQDIFIQKLDSEGQFIWVRSFGGIDKDFPTSITVDKSGNVLTVGCFYETVDFDPGKSIYELVAPANGKTDVYILKLDDSGGFVWAKQLSGMQDDFASAIQVDQHDNIYTTGHFKGTVDFDPSAGTYSLQSDQQYGYDVFIQKLNSSGELVWVKSLGGGDDDKSYALTLDHAANIYTTGTFRSTADFGNINLIANGWEDVFIQKISPSISVSTHQSANDFECNIFPNPSCGIINIEHKQLKNTGKIQVFDAFGRVILQRQPDQELTQIDLNNFTGGYYTVKVFDEEHSAIQSIILQSKY